MHTAQPGKEGASILYRAASLARLLLLGVGGSLILQRPDKMITARTFSLSIYPDGIYIFFFSFFFFFFLASFSSFSYAVAAAAALMCFYPSTVFLQINIDTHLSPFTFYSLLSLVLFPLLGK
jgi:hypothetical protein